MNLNVLKMVKRLCQKDHFPTHKEAGKILKQLKVNPEVCETCNIKPCAYAQYIYGRRRKP